MAQPPPPAPGCGGRRRALSAPLLSTLGRCLTTAACPLSPRRVWRKPAIFRLLFIQVLKPLLEKERKKPQKTTKQQKKTTVPHPRRGGRAAHAAAAAEGGPARRLNGAGGAETRAGLGSPLSSGFRAWAVRPQGRGAARPAPHGGAAGAVPPGQWRRRRGRRGPRPCQAAAQYGAATAALRAPPPPGSLRSLLYLRALSLLGDVSRGAPNPRRSLVRTMGAPGPIGAALGLAAANGRGAVQRVMLPAPRV